MDGFFLLLPLLESISSLECISLLRAEALQSLSAELGIESSSATSILYGLQFIRLSPKTSSSLSK